MPTTNGSRKSTSSSGSAKKSGGTAKKPAASKNNSRSAKNAPKPIRREVGAAVCAFLAIFSFIGYFDVDGWFIDFFCGFVKGILGWGFYLFPPALLLAAIALAFHRGRPVALRSFCALLLPVLMAAILSLIIYEPPFQADFDLKTTAGQLFESGQYLESAGALGGLLAIGLEMAFSIYGALLVLVVFFIACAICAFSSSFKKVAQQVKIRATAPYDPSLYEDALAPVGSVT